MQLKYNCVQNPDYIWRWVLQGLNIDDGFYSGKWSRFFENIYKTIGNAVISETQSNHPDETIKTV